MFFLSVTRVCQNRRRRRRHSVSTPAHVQQQKQTLTRSIATLERQLETRRAQLEHHVDVEEQLLTARQRTDDEQMAWERKMARGKSIYGDAWDHSVDGNVPIGTLMNMKKQDLVEIQAEARAQVSCATSGKSEHDASDAQENTIQRQNKAALYMQDQSAWSPRVASVIQRPSQQWTSYRKATKRTQQTSCRDTALDELDWGNMTRDADTVVPPMPKLDLTRLVPYDRVNPGRPEPGVDTAQMKAATRRRARLDALNQFRFPFKH